MSKELKEKKSIKKIVKEKPIETKFTAIPDPEVIGELEEKVLNENKIGCEIYYPLPLHVQECFGSLGYKKGDFPESEKAANETLALPISHEITQSQQEYIVEKIRRFFLGE